MVSSREEAMDYWHTEFKKMASIASELTAEVERLSAEHGRMRHHLGSAIQTMREMGTQSGQTISTSWVLRMAESALPDAVSGKHHTTTGDVREEPGQEKNNG